MSILFYVPEPFPPIAPWTENFTGTDGDSANPIYWNEGSGWGSGDNSIQSNQLRLKLILGEGAQSYTTFNLVGDFDIEISWNIYDSSGAGNWYADFSFWDGSNYFWIEQRKTDSDHLIRRNIISDVASTSTFTPGKWRLVRVGTVGSAYYDSGSGWVLLGSSIDIGSAGNGFVIMSAKTQYGPPPVHATNVTFDIDYFKVNSADGIVVS